MSFNISPIDSRYFNIIEKECSIFSEYNYYKNIYNVEIKWLKYFLNLNGVKYNKISNLENNFNLDKIKEIEKNTQHDIKSVEIFISNMIENKNIRNFVHYSLTSQDVVNFVYNKIFKEFETQHFSILINNLFEKIRECYSNDFYILGKTHGQPALPLKLSDFFNNYIERISHEIKKTPKNYYFKFGGAINNNFSQNLINEFDFSLVYGKFLEENEFERLKIGTQVDNYLRITDSLQIYSNICSILINFCQDMWYYISNDLFIIKNNKNYIGSSTMPSKVNPIKFENAEGNFQNALKDFNFYNEKFKISRLQRDLSDSTVIRNLGTSLSFFVLGLKNLTNALDIKINEEKSKEELINNFQVFSEYVQLFLKIRMYEDPYEIIKEKTQGKRINFEHYCDIIRNLNIKEKDKLVILNNIKNFYSKITKN